MEAKVNLFISGCIKGGTTWLHDVLSTSPNVFSSDLKEPHYFSKIKQKRPHIKHVGDLAEYSALFDGGEDYLYRMDGSATSLYEEGTAERIYKYNPDAKIVILLRHPVRRAFSHYQMCLREGVVSGDFVDVVTEDFKKGDSFNDSFCFLKMGQYYQQVKTYLDLFGENVLVLSYGDLVKSKESFVLRVSNFLDLNISDLEIKSERSNAAALPKGRFSKFILGNDYIRVVLQKVLPKNLRVSIKKKLLLKKSDVKLSDEECVALYFEYFKSDSERLFNLLNCNLWGEVNDI